MPSLSLRPFARLFALSVVLLGAASTMACAAGEAPHDHEDGSDSTEQDLNVTPWKLPASVKEKGEAEYIEYDDAPDWDGGAHCTGTFTSGAKALGDYLKANFAGIASIQGYSCRPNTADASQTSMHGTGRAIDVMVKTKGGAQGDVIGNWLVEHAEEIGVQFIIWKRTKWNGSYSGEKDAPYGGPNPHVDHLHVELNFDGAAKKTQFFTGAPNPSSGGGTPGGTSGGTDGCGSVTVAGECNGATLRYCDEGKVVSVDCSKSGRTCAWLSSNKYYDCE